MVREPFNYERLHPKARVHYEALSTRLKDLHEAGRMKTLFLPFEGYRSPEYQNYLFHVKKTTKARAFQSAHNYGLAVDYVAFQNGKWSWDDAHEWHIMAFEAQQRGLMTPIKWDKPHVQHPIWYQIRGALT